MDQEVRTITDRVLLLGLDGLYRSAMKRHETGELLRCARAVASDLEVSPTSVPIEGYYGETPALTEYFLLVRKLQQQPRSFRDRLSGSPQFERLEAVTSAPIFGSPDPGTDSLLPAGRDALFFALEGLEPSELSKDLIVQRARSIARKSQSLSLVSLAAFVGDSVLIAALRETVVLYAAGVVFGISDEPHAVYRWEVSEALLDRAVAFVAVFNQLFSESLAVPSPETAPVYWDEYMENEIHGRCVRIAVDPRRAEPNYHWGVYEDRGGEYCVEDFWAERLWTTSYYSGHQRFPIHATDA